MNVTSKQAVRFWSYVDIRGPNDCWPWKGPLYEEYGKYKIGSTKDGSRKSEYAHRIACELINGQIDPGQEVLHSCDFKPCCNPAHLEAGTCSKNHADAWTRGLKEGCKLTRFDAGKIRLSDQSNRALAESYGVTCGMIWAIKAGKRWERHAA